MQKKVPEKVKVLRVKSTFLGEKYLNEPILWHEKFSIPDKKCFENVTVDI